MDTLTTVTPSFVPLSDFGQMAAQKRTALDSVADIAARIAAAVNAIKAPVGQQVTQQAPDSSGSGGDSTLSQNAFVASPLFLVGLGVLALLLLNRK